MNAQNIKDSILQLAIQGKLVKQVKKETSVKEYINTIKDERKQLIKEGKIKKQKSLPKIEDNEIPFDIPDNWTWARMGDVIDFINGRAYKKEELMSEGKYPVLRVGNFFTNKNWYYSDMELEESKYCNKGDLLYAWSASFGPKIWDGDKSIFHYHIWKLDFDSRVFFRDYLYWFLLQDVTIIKKSTTGTTMVHVSMVNMRPRLIPIPPIEEQKRIVAKIEELLPYIDQYDKAYAEVEELNKKFPEDMQKSILQYAIQGKLVEQREEEGTAEELYQEIQEEKKRLIEEGKVKKPKKLMEITDEEIPYDIPENWKWVRLGDIFEINPRNTLNDDTNVSFIPMTLIEDGYRSEFSFETRSWGKVKKGYTHFRDGDIVMAKITPCFQNLKSAIMINLENGMGAGTTELHVLRAYHNICLKFFLWFLKSPIFVSTCVSAMTGTAGQQRVGTDTITNYVVPLPPLEEQKRIMDKIEEVLPHCKQLDK
ncbi:restriction endonuclease subunit S [Priestia megaterium]|uniref:restriction endonuclease subunit S n=1 Tax=Priestia megaterium TaxID=1404 RepID=UPI003CFD2A63